MVYVIVFLAFFMVTIISYFVLPQGLLKNKNPLQSWNTSDNVFILTLQTFFYNFVIFGYKAIKIEKHRKLNALTSIIWGVLTITLILKYIKVI